MLKTCPNCCEPFEQDPDQLWYQCPKCHAVLGIDELYNQIKRCHDNKDNLKELELRYSLSNIIPKNGENWLEIGIMLCSDHKFEQSISAFDHVINRSSEPFFDQLKLQAFLLKGIASYSLKKYDDVIFALNIYLENSSDSENGTVWTLLFASFRLLDQTVDAENAADHMLEFSDPKIGGFDELVKFFIEIKKYESALIAIEKILTIEPDVETLLHKIRILNELQKYSESKKICELIIENTLQNVPILLEYGKSLRNLDRRKDALNIANIALRLEPDNYLINKFKENIIEEIKKIEDLKLNIKELDQSLLIENFAKKYPTSQKNSTEFNRLVELFRKRGSDLTDDDYYKIVASECENNEYSSFSDKLFHNNPKTYEDCIRNFVELFGNNYGPLLVKFLTIVNEHYNYSGQINEDIKRIQSDIELTKFEDSLLSDSSGDTLVSIDEIDKISGYEFESLLKKLFEKKGYLVTHTSLSKDQGADLILEKFGERIVVQAKNWTNNVGNSAIQEVVASIKHYDANKSIVISSSGFTSSAIDLARSNFVELWDRPKLSAILSENPIFK
jgi:HJR/Mrr/RecB family endonuclease